LELELAAARAPAAVLAAALGLADAKFDALENVVRSEREKRRCSALRSEREEAQREIEREKQDIRQEMRAELERERAVLELQRESMRRDGEVSPLSAFHIPCRFHFLLSIFLDSSQSPCFV
jgi:hypothetical protein